MKKLKAVYYGQLELISGIVCDVYVLNDGTPAMSIIGVAELLSLHLKALQNTTTKGIPKALKPFINKDWNTTTKTVIVTAPNSRIKGREITVYDSSAIGTLIRAYSLALAHKKLRPNQMHIGERCVMLQAALTDTALHAVMKEACGLNPNIQQIAQVNYAQVGQTMKNTGLTSSIGNDIYTKKDITNYITVPLSTLNSNIRKLHNDISVINLDRKTIKVSGSKAPRMNGYNLEDVGKIILGMDSVIGIELKK